MTYNFFTLSFTGHWKHLEPRYLAFHFKESLVRIRIAILIAVLFYAGFSVLDAIIAPEFKHLFWMIRFGAVCPFALWILWYSYRPEFEKYCQLCLFSVCFAGGLGIALMIAVSGPPASYSYYAGIILILITIYTFLRMRFTWALGCSSLIVACYEIGAIWLSETPTVILINNSFFFISANIFCMLAGYSIELNSRKRFFSNLQMEKAKSELTRINLELDDRVNQRTRELMEKTDRLEQEIRERKNSEQQKKELEKQLFQAQKMEAIGTLAGGIAHDFNNILMSVLGFTELALGEAKKGSNTEEYLKEILDGGLRAKDLINQILTFSRQSEEDISPVRVGQVITDVLRFIRSSLPSTIAVKSEIASSALIMGNYTKIYQVLMNLCINAYHAMEETGGTLELNLKDLFVEKKSTKGGIELEKGAYVQLDISDTGTGIPPQILDTIFDPYYTTKPVGKGTGMGLAMVHGIIERYNGKISVASSLGKGSTFSIFLPMATGQILDDTDALTEKSDTGNERILFIDDDVHITKMVGETLSKIGYTVTVQTDSMAALALFKENPYVFDLVITDMTMPQLTGDLLAKKMISIRPEIPIILCTGFSKTMTREKALESGIKAFVLKPIVKQQMSKIVRQVLSLSSPAGRINNTKNRLSDE